ncbi:MAG: hypothetical protein WCC27_21340, partial [Acidobacteriaceae bacterium]
MLHSKYFAALVLIAAPVCAQQPPDLGALHKGKPETAADLVREVIYNELHDRERDSHWQYRSECLSSAENLVREQVETDNGPIFRLIAQNGNPLDASQREREDKRLDEYLHSPGQIARVERAHQEDEARLAAVMELLPQAFLFDYEGAAADNLVRISFRPDPAFTASGYEARIIHALAGTLTVDARLKRMIDMRGVLAERVDFGYGLLGHVEKGGSFEIHRRRVGPTHWKTDLVEVHIQGKILMLKTVSKDQREARFDFRPVPSGTTLSEAREMLSQAADQSDEAHLIPAAAR